MTLQAELFPVPEEWWVRRRCVVCGGNLAMPIEESTVTYIMQRQWWVKIGKSKHPETRRKELQAIGRQRYILTPPEMDLTEPILLVATFPGDTEHALHVRWRGFHARGEWFLPEAEMRDWLDQASP